MKRLAPEVLAAGRVRWQLWITLTWSGQVPRPEKRVRAFRLFVRRLAALARVPFDRLIWFCREEAGEKFSRPHFHVLIAGLPYSVLGFDFGFRLGHTWEGGFSEGRLWHEGLGALEYSSEEGANIYEGRKFRADLPLMVSESLSRVVGRGTGDNVGTEYVEQRDNPEVVTRDAGIDQRQLCLTSVVGEDKGYLVAANASRTHVEYCHQADVTGAC